MLEIFTIEKQKELCTLVKNSKPEGLFYGQPVGGALDKSSASKLFEVMSDESMVYEVSFRAAQIKFKKSGWIVITGADMGWSLDGKPIPLGQAVHCKVGQILKGSYAKDGFRSYVGIDLRKPRKKIKPGNITLTNQLEIIRGPEWNLLDQESKIDLMMYESTITSESDRQGYYLQGNVIRLKTDFPQKSVCTFPGVLQLLPNGQLVILLNDGQNTGGYPRVAYLQQEEISKLSQLRPGSQLTFNLCIKS